MNLIRSTFVKDNEVVLIDCRFNMANPKYGYETYTKGHIKNAYYVDLEKDMTSEITEHGGRHPLANLETFTTLIGSFGIKESTKVVIYDDGDMPMATRLWFMLKLIGLKQVFIVEGGFNALVKSGFEVTSDVTKQTDSQLSLNYQSQLICGAEEIKKAIDLNEVAIVDSRSKPRHLGLEEPYDKVAGRIPSAINYFWKDIFIEGVIKNYGDLEAMFLEMHNYDEIIVHCGSGITGCVNMFILEELGIKSKLYDICVPPPP